MEDLIHCGGVIVFNENLEFVAVVSERGNYGFPKGKREVGETMFETSFRELREETGLQPKDITLYSTHFDEINSKGDTCVRYLLAKYNSKSDFEFTFDKEELKWVGWVHWKKLFPLLILKNRPDILKKVVQFIGEQSLV